MYGFLIEKSHGEVYRNGKSKITLTIIKSIVSKRVDPEVFQIPKDYTIETYTKERYSELIAEYKSKILF